MADPRPQPSPADTAPLRAVPPDDSDEGNVRSVVEAAVAAIRRAGGVSLSSIADAIEVPVRALSRRVTSEAVLRPRWAAEPGDLAGALAERARGPLLGGATAAAFAAKLARRLGPLRFLARRTPMWLVAAAVPALYASVTRGAEELRLVASHLALRARAAGAQPDPERIRRAAVQVVTGAAVDPDLEPRHAPLVLNWLQRALRATLPFTDGVSTADPHGMAAAAAAVPVAELSTPALPG